MLNGSFAVSATLVTSLTLMLVPSFIASDRVSYAVLTLKVSDRPRESPANPLVPALGLSPLIDLTPRVHAYDEVPLAV